MSPQRKTKLKRIDASEAQGDGAYILLRKFTWGDRKELQKRFRSIGQDVVTEKGLVKTVTDELEAVILERLAEWNFVDEAGAPIPIPKTSDDLSKLQDDEIQFLFKTIQEFIKGVNAEDAETKK